jgi:hypothetical protein
MKLSRIRIAATVLMLTTVWSEAGLAASQGGSRAFLADSPWPVPTSDTWRSSSTPSGGLPADVKSQLLRTQSLELGPVPFLSVIADDALFVLGGSPFLLHLFTAAQSDALPELPDLTPAELLELLLELDQGRTAVPYVARIDPETMTAQVQELEKGDSLNYPGGIVAHQNGYLYAVATERLYEIDPASLEIVRSQPLPSLTTNSDTAVDSTVYNTLQVSPRNGDLILKTGSFGTGNGILVRVDIESLEVVAKTEAVIGTARSTVVMQGDVEFVYLPAPTETRRFVAKDDSFELDPGWSKTYRSDGDGTTPGVGMLNMGSANTVVFPNNNTVLIGVTTPLALGLQSTTNPEAPLRTINATGTSLPGGSFTMLAGNPDAGGTIVAQDSVNGRLAAWRVGAGGSFSLLWVTDALRVSIGSAVVIDADRLYVDDRTCANEQNQTDCKLFLVMLDLATGEEIARAHVAGTEASLSHIVIGDDEVYYVASEAGRSHGFVTRVTTKGRGHK